jgi:hypothetical protein
MQSAMKQTANMELSAISCSLDAERWPSTAARSAFKLKGKGLLKKHAIAP